MLDLEISKTEALDLLRKWKEEKQHISYQVEAAPEHDIVKGMGGIDQVSDGAVHIFAYRPADFPQDMFLDIPLVEAAYEYLEAREYLEAHELREIHVDPGTPALVITISPMRLRFTLSVFSPLP
jgi:hypothetical protein